MRALGIVMIEVFSVDGIQGDIYSIFANRKWFMTIRASNLHLKLLSGRFKYTTAIRFRVGAAIRYNYFMTKFYTRKGDDGYTGRLGKGRIAKHHEIIEAVGTVDETSAVLGMARSQIQDQKISDLLLNVQRDLYHLMSELSATKENAPKFRVLDEERLAWLEKETDLLSEQVMIPKEFVVPGDSAVGAILALGRSVVRRAERRVAELLLTGQLDNPILLRYLNRLSSLCFVLELRENQSGGSVDQTLAKTDQE